MSKSPLIRSFALAAALLSAGCLPPPAAFQPGPEWAVSTSVSVLPLVGASRHVQAVTPYVPGDVEWLRLELFIVGNPLPVRSVDVPKASIGNVITFKHLKYQTAYRLYASALNAGMSVISKPNVFVDLTTAGNRNDVLPPVSLTVPLLDKAFEAEGTFRGIEIQAGGFEPYGFVDDFANQQNVVAPVGVCADRAGTLYVIDGHGIRVLGPAAGSGEQLIGDPLNSGFTSGSFSVARFENPRGLALRESNDGSIKELYVADTGNHAIRVIDLNTNTVATVAGNDAPGYDNEASSVARFNAPEGVAVTDEGHVFVADTGNHAIRLLDPEVAPSDAGYVKTLAGPTEVEGATPGYMDAVATGARFAQPAGLALGETALLIADRNNHAVRALRFPELDVTTVAGNGASGVVDATGMAARFNGPSGLVARDDGTVYVADRLNHTIRRIDASRRVTTIAGDALAGSGPDNGTRQAARFNQPLGLAIWRDAAGQGHLFVADSQNGRIRKIR